MMKTVHIIMVLTAFGCALSQVKETSLDLTRYSSQVPSCPKDCTCMALDQNSYSSFNKAICDTIPGHLHQNIMSLQVVGDHHSITAQQISEIGGGLRELDLNECSIIDIEAGAFNSLNELVNLKLSNNYIGAIGKDTFSSPNLRVLCLDGNGIETIDDYAFAQLPNLQKLHLQYNELKKISFQLPKSLYVLDISHNFISSVAADLSKINLKTLDLCGNPLNEFPPIIPSSTLETLCLEGKAAVLPHNAAIKLPRLIDVTLVASSHYFRTELDSTTMDELSKLKKLMTLSIVNYYLQNLSFLMDLGNLANLKLHNVTLASYEYIANVLESLPLLSNLSIDNSTHLVKPILNNAQLVSRLTKLHYLSLRYTGLVTMTQHNIPKNTYLDISYNPLHCDCRLAWVWHKQTDTNDKFLLSKKQTLCETPDNAQGHSILESVTMKCSDQQTSGMLEQLSDDYMWTNSSHSTEGPMTDSMSNGSTNTTSSDKSHDNLTVYIALGTVLLILIAVGIALTVTLYVMKKRRKCQISPDAGETPMEQQPNAHQMKQASSKDMLIKK